MNEPAGFPAALLSATRQYWFDNICTDGDEEYQRGNGFAALGVGGRRLSLIFSFWVSCGRMGHYAGGFLHAHVVLLQHSNISYALLSRGWFVAHDVLVVGPTCAVRLSNTWRRGGPGRNPIQPLPGSCTPCTGSFTNFSDSYKINSTLCSFSFISCVL
jgi:hypothetical protein